jgi:hypothetical protein
MYCVVNRLFVRVVLMIVESGSSRRASVICVNALIDSPAEHQRNRVGISAVCVMRGNRDGLLLGKYHGPM